MMRCGKTSNKDFSKQEVIWAAKTHLTVHEDGGLLSSSVYNACWCFFCHFIYETVFHLRIITNLSTNAGESTVGTPGWALSLLSTTDPLVSVRARRAGTGHTVFAALLFYTTIFTKLLPRNGFLFPLTQVLQEKPVFLIFFLVFDLSCQNPIPLTVTSATLLLHHSCLYIYLREINYFYNTCLPDKIF
ncbi:hypothetical protein OIU76_009080 [Salix suchowensis]|nr:hypothetical protein OIU76_009080 [Salix suchowensis]